MNFTDLDKLEINKYIEYVQYSCEARFEKVFKM